MDETRSIHANVTKSTVTTCSNEDVVYFDAQGPEKKARTWNFRSGKKRLGGLLEESLSRVDREEEEEEDADLLALIKLSAPPPESYGGGAGDDDENRISVLDLDEYGLSGEQRLVFDMAMAGRSFFYTGSAGTGKSHTMRVIVEHLMKDRLRSRGVYVTASTGTAACNIGGTTLHSFAGIRLGEGTVETLYRLVSKNKQAVERWSTVETLIVDEISMVDAVLFEKIEALARRMKEAPHLPFGGIQLILCGDFFQLPPVHGRPTFTAKCWDRVVGHCIELRGNFRQRTDYDFAQVLNQLRFGLLSTRGEFLLNQCMVPFSLRDGYNEERDSAVKATVLYPHRADVNLMNNAELEKLKGPTYIYRARDTGSTSLQKLLEHCPAPSELMLKKGAQVVLLKNLDFTQGLVNGARGVVVDFARAGFGRGEKGEETDEEDEEDEEDDLFGVPLPEAVGVNNAMYGTKERQRAYASPIVLFTNGTQVAVREAMWEVKMGKRAKAVRYQVPLMLAWAISIHKSQGMTLEKVQMQLANVWECGQAYVALSRAATAAGLHLVNYQPYGIRADPAVIAFHRNIYRDQLEAEEEEEEEEVFESENS